MYQYFIFAPWLMIGLITGAALLIGQAAGFIARAIKKRQALAAMPEGHDRRYTVTFANHRGY